MDIFSNREIALTIWMVIIGAFLAFSPKLRDVRSAFKGVLKAFFVWKLQSVVLLMLGYIAIVVYWLSEIGIWDIDQLKNTILWTLTVAIASVYRVETIKKEKGFFKNSVLDSLKLTAILEFIFTFYSFPLIVEIILLPLITLIVLASEFAGRDSKYAKAKKVIDGILVLFGIILVGYTAYMLFTDMDEIAKEQTLYDFLIPILLTLCFIPFIFRLMVYTTYETVRIRTNYAIQRKGHRRFAKFLAMIFFNVRIELLERWSSRLPQQNIQSYGDVWGSVRSIFKMRAAERHPKPVDFKDGWSPYIAKDALLSLGFKTGYYRKSENEEWFSSCPYIDVGDGILPNRIWYGVEGDQDTAKKLTLMIYVNDPSTAIEIHEKLLEAGSLLFKYATGLEIPETLKEALKDGTDIKQKIANKTITVEKEMFANKTRNGYSVKFTIEI